MGAGPAGGDPWLVFRVLGLVLGGLAEGSDIHCAFPIQDTRSYHAVMVGTETPPEVLFVCVHNAGRSQMAAGFLSHLAGDRVMVRSAGSTPADRVNPAVVEAMAEIGVDMGGKAPTKLSADHVRVSDVVVTMGCGDACSILPGKRYLDWELDDPAGKSVEEVRAVRDRIESLVRKLLEDLGVEPSRSRQREKRAW